MANPEIVWESEDLAPYEEGCLSLPEEYAEVMRPARIRVRYLDEHNELREREADGLLAVVIQHEMDHLNGTLFVDHLSSLKRNMIVRRLNQGQEGRGPEGGIRAGGPVLPEGGVMRVIFMGTPDFSVPALQAIAARHDVVAVYCQPPRPAGRGQKDRPSPVQQAAEALGIPVRYPVSLRTPEAQADFAALQADIAVVAAYGLILPQGRAGCAASWLYQHSCVPVAPLARGLPRFTGRS